MNVGIDLSLWPRAEARAPGRPKILFVGGDFLRKGGDILLAAFERHLAASAELHLVTNRAPAESRPGCSCIRASSPTIRACAGSTPKRTCWRCPPVRTSLRFTQHAEATGYPPVGFGDILP